MKKLNQAIVYAAERGYRFDKDNNVISPRSNIRKIQFNKHYYYPKFSVLLNNKSQKISVHRFKAYLLYGEETFKEGIQVRHKNGNIMDWSDENILLGTQSDNMLDIPKEIRLRTVKKAASCLRRFTDGEVEQIRKLNKHGISYNRISRMYGVPKSTLSYIMNEKTYAPIA